MISVVCRYLSNPAYLDAMERMGFLVNRDLREEEQVAMGEGDCAGCVIVTTAGLVRTLLLTEKQVEMLDFVTSPAFLIDWIEGEGEAEMPTYTMPDGSTQGAPRFQ